MIPLEMFFSIIVIIAMIIALAKEVASPGFILFVVLGIFITSGILTPKEAISGFSNKGLFTVAVLFVVSQGVLNTGALNWVVTSLFRDKSKDKTISSHMFKMMLPVSFLSAFLNNTPIVVIFTPIVKKWADKMGFSASKFLIPLSYAAIFGGICTLIGTSTNLVVHGLMLDNGYRGFYFFELAQIGIPAAIVGYIYLLIFGHRILPNRTDIMDDVDKKRDDYIIEMKVLEDCSLIGSTIEESGLRHLKGLYLFNIERNGVDMNIIDSEDILLENDRLIFTGIPSSVDELNSIPGIVPVDAETMEEDFNELKHHLVEVVVSSSSSVLGKKIKKANFRSKYDSAVIAVHRNGERIFSKIGDIKLKPGDCLVLLTNEDFMRKWVQSNEFYLITYLKPYKTTTRTKSIIALSILGFMVIGATVGSFLPQIGSIKMDMFYFAVIASILIIITGTISFNDAKFALNFDVLLTIACSFGISKALQNSGAASYIAGFIIDMMKQSGAVGALAGVYLLTTVFTEIITNNAAAALIFPIALATATKLGVNPVPFFVAITVAASASFSTPIGYQTNLIVQGAGGYRFRDYLKIGLPLNILFFVASMILIPYFWNL